MKRDKWFWVFLTLLLFGSLGCSETASALAPTPVTAISAVIEVPKLTAKISCGGQEINCSTVVGLSVKIEWSSTGADRCTVVGEDEPVGWVVTEGTSGSKSSRKFPMDGSFHYTIQCIANSGTTTAVVTVRVSK